jgi:hypothetical protein
MLERGNGKKKRKKKKKKKNKEKHASFPVNASSAFHTWSKKTPNLNQLPHPAHHIFRTYPGDIDPSEPARGDRCAKWRLVAAGLARGAGSSVAESSPRTDPPGDPLARGSRGEESVWMVRRAESISSRCRAFSSVSGAIPASSAWISDTRESTESVASGSISPSGSVAILLILFVDDFVI